MDEHTVNLIRDQLAAMDRNSRADRDMILRRLDTLCTVLEEHVKKDERYWKRVDQYSGQVSIIAWFMGIPGVAGFFGWLYNTLIKS